MERPYTPSQQLRELLGMTYKESNDNSKERDCSRMKGFMSIMKCDYCKKQGHSSEECWTKHPSKRVQNNYRQKSGNRKEKQEITCWGCNK
ncbi:MAG: hypothetical protein GY775_19035 [Candidatus Scalindua sp.]|nr:hypothetical protein [Candidatus Scalindua sp.]